MKIKQNKTKQKNAIENRNSTSLPCLCIYIRLDTSLKQVKVDEVFYIALDLFLSICNFIFV